MVKNPPANAGDIRNLGLIPGSGRSPGGGIETHSSILARRIPWTEESGRLQSANSWIRLKPFSMHTAKHFTILATPPP